MILTESKKIEDIKLRAELKRFMDAFDLKEEDVHNIEILENTASNYFVYQNNIYKSEEYIINHYNKQRINTTSEGYIESILDTWIHNPIKRLKKLEKKRDIDLSFIIDMFYEWEKLAISKIGVSWETEYQLYISELLKLSNSSTVVNNLEYKNGYFISEKLQGSVVTSNDLTKPRFKNLLQKLYKQLASYDIGLPIAYMWISNIEGNVMLIDGKLKIIDHKDLLFRLKIPKIDTKLLNLHDDHFELLAPIFDETIDKELIAALQKSVMFINGATVDVNYKAYDRLFDIFNV